MWEIVELNSEQLELFKIELNRVSPLINREDWSEQFVFEHPTRLGTVGFTPGLFKVLTESIHLLTKCHPIALKDVPELKRWVFLYGDYRHFLFLQDYKEI